GDEQDVVAVADLADGLEIAGRRRHRAQGRADHRLGDEGSHVLGALAADLALKLGGATQVAATEPLAPGGIGAAVGVSGGDVRLILVHAHVAPAAVGVAAEAQRTQRIAVEALPAGNHDLLGGLARFDEVLAGNLDGVFGRLRAAIDEPKAV